jgi:hypothetical protein
MVTAYPQGKTGTVCPRAEHTMNSEGMDFLRLIAYALTATITGIVMVILILIATH